MKLTYRGAQYDYQPTVLEVKDTFETGKYRGVDIRFRTVKKTPVHQPTLDLMYRGVTYRTGSNDAPGPAAVTPGKFSETAEHERDFCQVTTS